MWTNKFDPVMTCQPLGVPRQGPPRRIYQSENDITFLYFGGDAGGGYGEYRIIPTDGRARDKNAEFDITYMGNTMGRWEGDTLVLDSIAFIDTTWIGRGGFFHSDHMHVVERFRRQGDVIFYDVTIEDPRCCWSRGCSRRERCGATPIPTRAFCENEATARPISRPKRRPRRFGIRRSVEMAKWTLRCVVLCGASWPVLRYRRIIPGGHVRLGKGSEGHRGVQGVQVINPHSSMKTRRQGPGGLRSRVELPRRQRPAVRAARRRQNRPQFPQGRGRGHCHAHAGAGRQEPDWAPGGGHYPDGHTVRFRGADE